MWMRDEAMVKRLISGIDAIGEGCHEWQRGRCQGYGRVRVGGTVGYAHRMIMELSIGRELGPDEHVLHSCDNRRCANIKHLRIGDNASNVADRKSRQRGPWGERHRSARLAAQDVHEIRAMLKVGTRQDVLAARYGVTPVAISNIKTGRTWGNLVSPS